MHHEPSLTFVVPALDGPPTGGTRYNRCLVEALRAQGEAPRVRSLDEAIRCVNEPGAHTIWVDSLWMDALPQLVRQASPSSRVGMLTHWLPTLVSHGQGVPRSALSPAEDAALDHAQGLIVPSDTLATELGRLGVDPARVLVLEPGSELPVEPYPVAEHRGPVQAIVVANIVEGKGILPLLDGLAEHLRRSDALELLVVGSPAMAPEYAERCAALVSRHPALRGRVRFTGSCPHRACIEALLRSDVLISASRMESYGMALADARAAGRPILARPGGHVATHVDPRWGGELLPDEDRLAAALARLVRDRDGLAERQRRAWAHRRQRAWSAVASELGEAAQHWPYRTQRDSVVG